MKNKTSVVLEISKAILSEDPILSGINIPDDEYTPEAKEILERFQSFPLYEEDGEDYNTRKVASTVYHVMSIWFFPMKMKKPSWRGWTRIAKRILPILVRNT